MPPPPNVLRGDVERAELELAAPNVKGVEVSELEVATPNVLKGDVICTRAPCRSETRQLNRTTAVGYYSVLCGMPRN